MIKNLKDISEKELEYMKSHPIEVYEKLDLIRFNVECFDTDGYGGSIVVKTSKGAIIDNVDCVVNTVMNDIVDFVNRNLFDRVEEILDMFNGGCTINMFYAPVNKPHIIDYDKLDCPLFIVANVKDCPDGIQKIRKILRGIDHLSFMYPTHSMPHLHESFDVNDDSFRIMSSLMGYKTWSLNDMENIEGCIIKCGRKTYQIINKDTTVDIDKTTKKIYRDMLIDNFCNVVLENSLTETILNEGGSYIDIMSKLFLSYLDKTTIFSRVSFDAEDLLPPTVGYIGDIYYDALPVALRYVCKTNAVYKNLLKVLLVAFDSEKIKTKKDTDIDYEKFGNLKDRINISVIK